MRKGLTFKKEIGFIVRGEKQTWVFYRGEDEPLVIDSNLLDWDEVEKAHVVISPTDYRNLF